MVSDPIIRGLVPDDWPDALVLLEKVFGVGPWLFHSLHRGTTRRNLDHVSGAWVDGELVSLVDVFLRELRWLDGRAMSVGCIGSVATHPEYRRRGLSGALIERSIRTMSEVGCDWSLLFTGVHAHYERYGWSTQTLRRRVGLLHPERPLAAQGVTRKGFFRLGETDQHVEWHRATNELRPLSTARTWENWAYAVRERMNRPNCTTLITGSAYAFLVVSERCLSVREVGGDPSCFGGLAAEAHALATESGADQVELAIPIDPLFDGFADVLGVQYRIEESRWSMSRPISDAVGEDDLRRLFAAPGSHHYALDDF